LSDHYVLLANCGAYSGLSILFQIRWRSDFSFRVLIGRSGRYQREVGRLLGEWRV